MPSTKPSSSRAAAVAWRSSLSPAPRSTISRSPPGRNSIANGRGKPLASTVTLIPCCSAVSNRYGSLPSVSGAIPGGGGCCCACAPIDATRADAASARFNMFPPSRATAPLFGGLREVPHRRLLAVAQPLAFLVDELAGHRDRRAVL